MLSLLPRPLSEAHPWDPNPLVISCPLMSYCPLMSDCPLESDCPLMSDRLLMSYWGCDVFDVS